MKIKIVSILYFSPTGNVQNNLRKIAHGMGDKVEIKEYDLTPFDARWEKYEFTSEDFVLIGMPVYMGRLPGNYVEFFRCLKADRTPAAFVVSYGNIDYGDALLELKNRCEGKGFIGIAAVAFADENPMVNQIAGSLSDTEKDNNLILFGEKIMEKAKELTSIDHIMPIEVKGNYPYKKVNEITAAPETNENCIQCGQCAKECPMYAINPSDTKEIDRYRCITCFRCIKNCHQNAKFMQNEAINQYISTSDFSTNRKEPVLI